MFNLLKIRKIAKEEDVPVRIIWRIWKVDLKRSLKIPYRLYKLDLQDDKGDPYIDSLRLTWNIGHKEIWASKKIKKWN